MCAANQTCPLSFCCSKCRIDCWTNQTRIHNICLERRVFKAAEPEESMTKKLKLPVSLSEPKRVKWLPKLRLDRKERSKKWDWSHEVREPRPSSQKNCRKRFLCLTSDIWDQGFCRWFFPATTHPYRFSFCMRVVLLDKRLSRCLHSGHMPTDNSRRETRGRGHNARYSFLLCTNRTYIHPRTASLPHTHNQHTFPWNNHIHHKMSHTE